MVLGGEVFEVFEFFVRHPQALQDLATFALCRYVRNDATQLRMDVVKIATAALLGKCLCSLSFVSSARSYCPR